MRPDTGWSTVQMPVYVSVNHHQKPTYVDPVLKAQEAATLRAQVEAFLSAGNEIEQASTPRPSKCNGRKA